MIMFLTKFTITVTILILKLPISNLDGDVPRSTFYRSRAYISQLNQFTRASSHVAYFNTRNRNFLKKAISLITFLKLFFLNSIANTMIRYL